MAIHDADLVLISYEQLRSQIGVIGGNSLLNQFGFWRVSAWCLGSQSCSQGRGQSCIRCGREHSWHTEQCVGRASRHCLTPLPLASVHYRLVLAVAAGGAGRGAVGGQLHERGSRHGQQPVEEARLGRHRHADFRQVGCHVLCQLLSRLVSRCGAPACFWLPCVSSCVRLAGGHLMAGGGGNWRADASLALRACLYLAPQG